MKQGKFTTLQDFALEIQRQSKSKRDFYAPLGRVYMNGQDQNYRLNMSGIEKDVNVSITKLCHQQIAERIMIPRSYYDLMKDQAPDLLRKNVNHWFSERKEEKKLIRVLDNQARAFLSDRFRPLDNYDLMEAALPVLTKDDSKVGKIQIAGYELTDNNLYLKVLTPEIQAEIKPGDVVQAGIMITNSEVGLGALKIEPLVYRLVCSNGLISPDHSMRKAHLGKRFDLEVVVYEMLQDSTKKSIDDAFWKTCGDLVRSALSNNGFESIVAKMRVAARTEIPGSPDNVVEVFSKEYSFSKPEKESILTHLAKGGDLTQWGYVNAVTRSSQDLEDYDRALEFERIGGKILDLDHRDIDKVAHRVSKIKERA
jgi:hypothetical protein